MRKLLLGMTIAAALVTTSARAEVTDCQEITFIPDFIITTQGVHCLKSDKASGAPSGTMINIQANNVTIDLNGFKLDGLGASTGTNAIGIFAQDRKNITIRNGAISGFRIGVLLDQGAGTSSGHLLEDLLLDQNRQYAASIEGSDNVIRNNRVENTGSHAIFSTARGIAVESASNTVVANNVVSGTSETFLASGIFVNFSTLIEVRGNSILDTKDATTKRGIDIAGSTDVTVIDNRIVNAAGTGTQGIIDSGGSTGINCIDNTIAGFIAPLSDCDFEAGNNTGNLPAVVQHDLQVSRFTTTSLTDAEADTIVADATTVLQINDGPGDVACDVAMVRDGAVTVFSTGDGSIDSQAEFNAVIALPGNVKAVNQINFCGGLIPNVVGCAPVPGTSFVIVRVTASLEGILWTHEFGHNKGLNHRNDPNAVMNGSIGGTHRRVDATECTAFSALPALLALVSEPAMAQNAVRTNRLVTRVAGTVIAQKDKPGPMNVRDFVRQLFIEGVPYEQASAYGSSAVPALLAMLDDPGEQAHWPNIVVVLGMIGDERAVQPLIAFIEADGEGGLSRAHYVAKTSAVMSMGYLINKTGNQQALDFVMEGAKPETWAGRKVGIAPFQSTTSERDFDFSKYAIFALALSGHPQAAETLRSLQQPAQTDVQGAFQAQAGDLVSEALKENAKIAAQGLADYYRRP